ncbi:MAG: alkaline phosphatase [Bacteroidales bacterium]|nr:alkaline phosphatase [Bacteroidales bacterium]
MKMVKSFLFYISVIALLLTSCSNCSNNENVVCNNDSPKNVVLMIGDGMGLAQVYSLLLVSENRTSFERFPYSGLAITRSFSNKVTDSAAAGTAIATGHKTRNHIIGMTADSIPVPSLLEILAEKGKKTGVVVTCYASHATPAAFLAHNVDRNKYEEITSEIVNREDLDLLIAGGRKYFNERKDNGDLIEVMRRSDWSVHDSLSQITDNEVRTAVIASRKNLPKAPDRGDFLPDATARALEILNRGENGFFLMVEGSQIDMACHKGDSTYLVEEMKDFDKTINVVLDFAENNENTLVIVAADHETGGLTIIDSDGKYTKTEFKFSTRSHTPVFVPVFAYGPGAENFSGIFDNTDIMKKILEIVR